MIWTAAIGVMAGCDAAKPTDELSAGTKPTQSSGALVASQAVPAKAAPVPRTSGISLFGELGDEGQIPFATQAARGLQQHTFTQEGGDFDPDVDPSGRLLIFASTRHALRPDIYAKAVGGSAVTQLTDDPASDVQPAISGDGKRVAFTSDRSGNWDIWVTSVDGQNTRQLTKSPKAEVHPSWSPDGQQLVYCALNPRTRQWELWVADLRQPGAQKFVAAGLFPNWSPKEDVIAFQRARARGGRWFSVWTIRLVDGEPRYPTEIASSSDQALIAPTWSRDGAKIVYCSVLQAGTASGGGGKIMNARGNVWITDANGLGRIRLTKSDAVNYSPACAPDGRIYFTSNRSGYENIWSIVPIAPSAPMADARSSGETAGQ